MKSSRARAAAAAAKPDAAGAARPAEEPVEATEDLLADGPLIVPPQDKKSYRLFVLRNGMRVMVVHDPLVAAAEAAEAAEAAAKARRGTKRRSPADDGGDCDGEGEGDDGSASSGSYEEMSSGEAARVAEEEEEQEEDDGESSGSEEEEEEQRDGSKGGSGDDAGDDDGGRKQAAAALAVGAGSFLDPPGRQGLAHLLEHMLFMGSRRFPSENAYDDYLTRHGGSSNAYTELVRDRLLECRARAGSEEEEKAAHRSPAAGPRVTPSLNPLSNNTPSTQQKQPTGVHQLPLRGAALRPQGSPRAPRRLLQRPPLLVLLLVARDQSSGFRVCRRAADGPRSAGAAVRGDSEKGPSDAGVCLGQPGVALGRGLCGGDGWWWW